MRAIVILVLAGCLAGAPPAEARTRPHTVGLRAHKMRAPRPHAEKAPKKAYRTVRVKRADGTVLTGYRDSTGTHLRGADGRTIHCQRQKFGAADVDIACR